MAGEYREHPDELKRTYEQEKGSLAEIEFSTVKLRFGRRLNSRGHRVSYGLRWSCTTLKDSAS